LRVHQPVGHLEGGVDDLLALGGTLAARWQRPVYAVDKPVHGLDCGTLTVLD
jgi:hypothetical protein